MRIRRILAPTDFSTISLAAVDYALGLARDIGAELALLYVEDTASALPAELVSSATGTRVMEQAHRAAQHQLKLLAGQVRKPGLKVHALILAGPAATRIVEAASKLRADWIVMGTHGRTGMARAYLGSIAERVVRQATCPVLMVPSRKAPARRARR